MAIEGDCGFCNRVKNLTFHHYIPRTLHTNKYFRKLYDKAFMKSHGIDLCKDCHDTIHDFWDEKTLGKKILNDPKFKKYLKWVVKQH